MLVLALPPAESVLLAIFVASVAAILRERPSLKHFGPLLLVWGLAMFMLLFIRDLGSSLMFFGGFLALLYVATARLSLIGVGATMFLGGATYFASTVSHVQDRVDVWRDPFDDALYDKVGGSYQIAQSLFAQADGGLFGRGFGQALLELPGSGSNILPAAHTDLIYAVIVNEIGLFGACGLLLVYLLFVGPRVQDGHGGRRRLLQAAGRGAERGVRAAGVRDRGRRDQGHPADRRDAAVRVLRRQLDRGQHDAAGAAADRLRPRAP